MRFVPAEDLKTGMLVGRDIIFTTKAAILKKHTQLNERYIDFLREKGYMGVYVTDSLSMDIEPEETIDPDLFQAGVEAVMEEDVDELMGIAIDIVDDILKKDHVCADLLDLRAFDDYTYHHCVNVAVFSVLVGKTLGLKEKELNQVCQAGLLHDIGKSKINPDILNKFGRLSDYEYAEIQKHAQYSYDILTEMPNISSVIRMAVLSHHENVDGSGYPSGKEGNKIPLLAKIIHAVDVYDALTTKRPYKEPYEAADAFDYLEGGKNTLFDSKVVDAIIKTLPPYPIGIDVYLSDGRRALVIEKTKDPFRPVIRLYDSGIDINLHTSLAYKNLKITRSGVLSSTERTVESLNEDRMGFKRTKKTVLVIDDTALGRRQIEDILMDDYNIIALKSGMEAIDFLKTSKTPDIIVSDVEMPYMNGPEAIKKIKDMGFKNIPVVFLSGNKDRDVIIQCRMIGASDYILKPVKPIYLKERIRQILENDKI